MLNLRDAFPRLGSHLFVYKCGHETQSPLFLEFHHWVQINHIGFSDTIMQLCLWIAVIVRLNISGNAYLYDTNLWSITHTLNLNLYQTDGEGKWLFRLINYLIYFQCIYPHQIYTYDCFIFLNEHTIKFDGKKCTYSCIYKYMHI